MTQTLTTCSSADLTITEVKPGLKFPTNMLRTMLPDVETMFFFGKVYALDAYQLGALLSLLFGHKSSVARELTAGTHSTELQDYLVDLGQQLGVAKGKISTGHVVPQGEILPELWKSIEVEVAKSISDVAAKMGDMVGLLPGKKGELVFRSLMVMNAKRPTIGDHRARIKHKHGAPNLVILDVSGSMTSGTIRAIVDDVVALSYVADAHLAIVSNTTTTWGPGEFSSDSVLAAAEFGGTQYETLAPLFDQDWGTVITVADYDSSYGAKETIANAKGRVEEVLDISLVGRPTFLAECVGTVANKMRPVLIAARSLC